LDHLTVPLAAAMAPMLLAVAIFSLTLLRQTQNAHATYTDELFALLSGICLLGSATSADAAMDSCKATWQQRLIFLRTGYPLFCLAIGTLTAAVPILYAETGCKTLTGWRYLLFGVTGLTAAIKPMLYVEYKEYSWTVLMFACYFASIIVLWATPACMK
jgi:hypothetical protein